MMDWQHWHSLPTTMTAAGMAAGEDRR